MLSRVRTEAALDLARTFSGSACVTCGRAGDFWAVLISPIRRAF